MAITFVQSGILLTKSDVVRWREQRLGIDLKIKALREEAAFLDKKLDAAAVFMEDERLPVSDLSDSDEQPMVESNESGPPMTEVVLGLFSRDDRFPPNEVVELVGMIDGVAGSRRANPNNIYTSLRRLTERKKLTRHEDGTYTLYQEATEPPEDQSASGPQASEGHYPSLIFNPEPAHAE